MTCDAASKLLATLINAVIEERAYNIGHGGMVGWSESLEKAKKELRAEYPGVEF